MDSEKSCRPSGRRVVAGLDVSLRGCGLAILFPGEKVFSKTFGYGLTKGSERDSVERNLFIASNVMKLLRQYEVAAVTVENYAFSRDGRLTALAELTGTLKTQILVALKIVAIPLSPTSVRSFLIPNANQKDLTDKKKIQEYLKSRGFCCKTPDEYDALACALICDVWLNDRGMASSDQQIRLLDKMDWHIRRNR